MVIATNYLAPLCLSFPPLISACLSNWSSSYLLSSTLIILSQKIQSFGRPFVLVIHEGETLAQIKVRMQKKLKAPDEAFAKVWYSFSHYRHALSWFGWKNRHSHCSTEVRNSIADLSLSSSCSIYWSSYVRNLFKISFDETLIFHPSPVEVCISFPR